MDSLAVEDAVGDLADPTGLPSEGLGNTDITGLTVSLDGDHLTVRWDVAEAVPEAPDPNSTTIEYDLLLDTDADDYLNKIVKVTNSSLEGVSDGGWHVDLWDLDSVEAPPLLEDAVVLDANLTASIPLAALGSPTDVRFQGLMIASDYPDPDDPLTVVEWSDRAPDADDEWRGVGSVEG